jgi:hypothetical protein
MELTNKIFKISTAQLYKNEEVNNYNYFYILAKTAEEAIEISKTYFAKGEFLEGVEFIVDRVFIGRLKRRNDLIKEKKEERKRVLGEIAKLKKMGILSKI